MRIGILITSIGNFGQKGFYNVQEIGLAKALDKVADEVRLYKLVPIGQEKCVEEIEGCKNAAVFLVPAKSWGINGRLSIEILDTSLDVLIYFSDTQFAVPQVYAWAEQNQVRLFPYIGVVESHSTCKLKKWFVDWMFKRNLRVYRKCRCFAKTLEVQQNLESLGVNGITLMPVGLDLELLRKDYEIQSIDELKIKYGYQKEDRILLFIGRLSEEKRPLKMIEIFTALSRGDEAYKLLMVGVGELEDSVERVIEACGVKDRIHRIPCIPNNDIWELYRIADSFINLNQQEIFGMAILEAMYYGCKVVAWRAPGPNLIIENGVSGWLAESDQDVVDKIKDEQDLSLAAHERVINKFTWDKTVDSVLHLLA